uniref:Uncharacterized protein n=1 Tax=Caenorhabditis japonica TaxID=281687 RepID=A0A8R1ILF7_CAEJA
MNSAETQDYVEEYDMIDIGSEAPEIVRNVMHKEMNGGETRWGAEKRECDRPNQHDTATNSRWCWCWWFPRRESEKERD